MRRIIRSGAAFLLTGGRLLRVGLGPGGQSRLAFTYCSSNSAFSKTEENPSRATSLWLENCLKEKPHLPVFRVKGENITVLREPWEFYQTLKTKAALASKRIVLASLYLGTGQLEQELVDTIHERSQELAADSADFEIKILLEHTRGSRGTKNSRTMLLRLLQEFPENVNISLYHTPKLRGLLRAIVPERFNETISAMHLKVYIFDDTLVMSGANLSNDYFTNRQDRCIIFENCKELCDYFHELVNTVSSFSLQLHPDDTTRVHEGFPEHPYEGNKTRYIAAAREKMESFLKRYSEQRNNDDLLNRKFGSGKQTGEIIGLERGERVDSEMYTKLKDELQTSMKNDVNKFTKHEENTDGKHEAENDTKNEVDSNRKCQSITGARSEETLGTRHDVKAGTKHEKTGNITDEQNEGTERETRNATHETNSVAKHEAKVTIQQEAKTNTIDKAKPDQKHEAESEDTKHERDTDTFVIPLIQMYPLSITDDENVTSNLIQYAPSQSKIFIATAYFNLTNNYWNRILKSPCNDVDIVMAHPKANGFFEAPGMAGGIPHAYTLIAKQYYKDIVKFKQQDRIRFWEYLRPNWTFHGKGLWAQIGNSMVPYITMIGSSNFGNRSAYRDLEAQALIITSNETVAKQLSKEKENLMDYSIAVDSSTYREQGRKIPFWVFLIRTFMKTFF